VKMSDSFGACLKIMDDNHWLVEWIAYHYFALPLRHLVVYVDPDSSTSPLPILDRWRAHMKIEVWNETYDPVVLDSSNERDPTRENRMEQRLFLNGCMKWYKRQNLTQWIVLVDTDEVSQSKNMADRIMRSFGFRIAHGCFATL